VLWSYVALVGCYLACTYAAVIIALAQHQTRTDANGVPAFIDHPAGWYAAATKVFTVLLPAYWLLFVLAQAVSWRRSSGVRRQQLKWLMTGAGILAISQAVIQAIDSNPNLSVAAQGILNTVSAISLAALPVGLAVAIMRYRLYDIDRIISRTLAYAVVTGLLVGVYAGLVLLATHVLSVKSPVAVAVATLAAAALFNPLRHRVQKIVDRRFNRARYDANQMAAAFAARPGQCGEPGPRTRPRVGVDRRTRVRPCGVTAWRGRAARRVAGMTGTRSPHQRDVCAVF
jgi:hypothetical protein